MKVNPNILLNPTYIGAVLLLFANDFWLKLAFPGFVTGKLSDIAGVFAFAVFLMALFPAHRYKMAALSALVFSYWKSPFSQPFMDAFNAHSFYKISRVIDYSDLFALVLVPLAILFFEKYKVIKHEFHFLSKMGMLACSLFVFCSTSRVTHLYNYDRQGEFYASKKHWQTPLSIPQLEEKFRKIAPTILANSEKTQWELNDIRMTSCSVMDVSLQLMPQQKKTQIHMKSLYICNTGYNRSHHYWERLAYKKIRSALENKTEP